MATRRSALIQACVGLLILLAGLAGMTALVVVTYGECAVCQAWALRLGLSLGLLFSAIAQSMVLLGGWLVWRSAHRVK